MTEIRDYFILNKLQFCMREILLLYIADGCLNGVCVLPGY